MRILTQFDRSDPAARGVPESGALPGAILAHDVPLALGQSYSVDAATGAWSLHHAALDALAARVIADPGSVAIIDIESVNHGLPPNLYQGRGPGNTPPTANDVSNTHNLYAAAADYLVSVGVDRYRIGLYGVVGPVPTWPYAALLATRDKPDGDVTVWRAVAEDNIRWFARYGFGTVSLYNRGASASDYGGAWNWYRFAKAHIQLFNETYPGRDLFAYVFPYIHPTHPTAPLEPISPTQWRAQLQFCEWMFQKGKLTGVVIYSRSTLVECDGSENWFIQTQRHARAHAS